MEWQIGGLEGDFRRVRVLWGRAPVEGVTELQGEGQWPLTLVQPGCRG